MKNDDDFSSLLLCVSQVVVVSTLQAVKISPLIERVGDHKDFKKLLRTRTNVLVLYTKSGKSRAFVIECNGITFAHHLVSLTFMAFRDSLYTKDQHFLHSFTSAEYQRFHLSVHDVFMMMWILKQHCEYSSAAISPTLSTAFFSFVLNGRGMHSAMCDDVWFPGPSFFHMQKTGLQRCFKYIGFIIHGPFLPCEVIG